MVAVEGIPSTKYCPASAESLGGIEVEATDIGAHGGRLIKRRKFCVLFYRDSVLRPKRGIVSYTQRLIIVFGT